MKILLVRERKRLVFSSLMYLLYVCVFRHVWPGIWSFRDAGLRWGKGEGVRNVPGLQLSHLDRCSVAGNFLSTDSDSKCVPHQNRQIYSKVSGANRLFNLADRTPPSAQVMPLSICVCLFVVSPGAGWSGHSSGHQVCRQHPQGLCYIALHHPVNSYIVLLAAGLRPHRVEEMLTIFLSVSPQYVLFFFPVITVSQAESVICSLSTACSSWGPFWSSWPLSCTATKASRPPTPAGRRTLMADTTAAVGGPVEASRQGGERRTGIQQKKKEGKGLYRILWSRKRRSRGVGSEEVSRLGTEERKRD